MSDWIATHDGIAAANGGLDLEMPAGLYFNADMLVPAVKSGKVTEATIDDKIRRMLRLAARFGWISPDPAGPGWISHDPLDPAIPRYNQQGRQVALEGALESATLLKNEKNLLPLDPAKFKNIAVIGPNAFPATPTAAAAAWLRRSSSQALSAASATTSAFAAMSPTTRALPNPMRLRPRQALP